MINAHATLGMKALAAAMDPREMRGSRRKKRSTSGHPGRGWAANQSRKTNRAKRGI